MSCYQIWSCYPGKLENGDPFDLTWAWLKHHLDFIHEPGEAVWKIIEDNGDPLEIFEIANGIAIPELPVEPGEVDLAGDLLPYCDLDQEMILLAGGLFYD